jgi:hypothetical protein
LDLNLATKKPENSAPTVSKLPLPLTDSALVIDLPDGQKIVVGKMTQGSVIEVATWRGVGRPDSRTSRLMLGVGSGNVDDAASVPETSSSASPRKVKPQGWKIVLYYLSIVLDKVSSINIKKPLGSIKALVGKIKMPKKSLSKSSTNSLSTTEPTQSIAPQSSIKSLSTVDEDVEAWLNKISEKASKRSALEAKSPRPAVNKSVTVKKATQKPPTSKSKRK